MARLSRARHAEGRRRALRHRHDLGASPPARLLADATRPRGRLRSLRRDARRPRRLGRRPQPRSPPDGPRRRRPHLQRNPHHRPRDPRPPRHRPHRSPSLAPSPAFTRTRISPPLSLAPLPPPSLDPQSSGFDLTLSGHTHGGQLGLSGRSVLEMLRPGAGWWGTYARKRPDSVAARRTKLESTPSRLYTTSGFGHWFPSRLGCPTEMPIIVLERGQPEARAAVARAV